MVLQLSLTTLPLWHFKIINVTYVSQGMLVGLGLVTTALVLDAVPDVAWERKFNTN